MNSIDQDILAYLAVHPSSGCEAVRKAVAPKASRTTIRWALKRLVDSGKLEAIGQACTTIDTLGGTSDETYLILSAEVDSPHKAAIVYRDFIREAVRYWVLQTKAFREDDILDLAARHNIPKDDLDGVIAYAHEQFRGLHEGNLIRYRLKPGDIQGVDLS